MLRWNKALALDVGTHVTSLDYLEYFISVLCSYATLKYLHDSDPGFKIETFWLTFQESI